MSDSEIGEYVKEAMAPAVPTPSLLWFADQLAVLVRSLHSAADQRILQRGRATTWPSKDRLHTFDAKKYLSRAKFALSRALLLPSRHALQWLDSKRAVSTRIMGIEVLSSSGSGDSEKAVGEGVVRLHQALLLLASVEPRRIARLRTDVARVVIRPAPTSGYRVESNTIVISSSFRGEDGVVTIAGDLIHELTHARFEKAGIRLWPDLRERIEHRCLVEQINFLEKLPNSERLVEHYRGWLERSWWTPSEQSRLRLDFFREIGLPEMLIRVYIMLSARASSEHEAKKKEGRS